MKVFIKIFKFQHVKDVREVETHFLKYQKGYKTERELKQTDVYEKATPNLRNFRKLQILANRLNRQNEVQTKYSRIGKPLQSTEFTQYKAQKNKEKKT